ncbi:DUF389 domain-containing protein [bacterium]|nr:DUF389 domain-containing protein [bacterium]
METTKNQDSASEAELKQSVGGIANFLKSLFAISEVDYAKASENIKADVSFRGFNIWILICSILICSLGLNLNSTAVVIGAMLISPLMGPINGMGLAIGTFDRLLLRKSLINLGVATAVSILTAFIFFKITPTGDDLHELFSRKTPVILDLFIAFFGGVAGILAASRCLSTNVVPGVAIATALMPPLCTTGYGLATWQMDYFLGAFYLFFMNCVMISLAAVIIVLYLKYPKYSFVNEAKKRKVRAGIVAFVVLLSIPSVILYYNLITEGKVDQTVKEFITEEFDSNRKIYVDNYKRVKSDSADYIRVSIKGEYLDENEIKAIESRMDKYGLNAYVLEVVQSGGQISDDELANFGQKFKVDILADLYDKNEQQLKNKQDEIELLQSEIRRINVHNLGREQLAKLVKSQFDINEFAVDNLIYIGAERKDTIPTAIISWKPNAKREEQIEKMEALLKIELEAKEVRIYHMN